jgi:predicted O-methyltransferase YrrM
VSELSTFLEVIAPGRPAFLKDTWVQGLPVRHAFMLSTGWALAQQASPKRALEILEIGVWMGASCLTWAEALDRFNEGRGGRITGIDPLTPYFDAAEQSSHQSDESEGVLASQREYLREMEGLLRHDFVHDILMHNMRSLPPHVRFELIRKASAEALPALAGRRFDLVYIDGSHFYEPVAIDLDWACRLTPVGGIICGDDLELQLDEIDVDFARAHTNVDFPTDPKTGTQYHPGVTLAVGERFGRVASYLGFWGVRKTGEKTYEPLSFAHAPLIIPSHLPESVKATVLAMLKHAGVVR